MDSNYYNLRLYNSYLTHKLIRVFMFTNIYIYFILFLYIYIDKNVDMVYYDVKYYVYVYYCMSSNHDSCIFYNTCLAYRLYTWFIYLAYAIVIDRVIL